MNVSVVRDLIKYQDESNINNENEKDIIRLLDTISKLEYKDKYMIQTQYINYVYNLYFNLGKFYDRNNAPFKAKQNSLYYIKSILDKYNTDYSKDDVINALYILIKNSLKNFIFNNDSDELNKILKIINEINSYLNLDIYNNDRVKEYLYLIKYKKFKFIMSFIIPFPIYVDSDNTFTSNKNNKLYNFKFSLISNKENFIQGQNTFLIYEKDRYGLYNKSIVTIDGILDLNNKFNKCSACNYSYLVDESIEIINEFIDCFKLIDNFYWVQRINKYMLAGFSLEIKGNNDKLYRIEYSTYNDEDISIRKGISDIISKKSIENIYHKYSNGYKLWESILSDAKDYYDIGKYREVIILINNAFENYIETEIKIKIEAIIGKDMTENLYNGVMDYDTWKLKDKFTYLEFIKFKELELIRAEKPTTFKIIKRYTELANIKISKTRLDKIIRKIRNKRNDIIHGRIHNFSVNELKHISKEAINSFEELITVL